MKINKNKQAFSILIAILMIGFLLILVVGMFNLMLRDMKDNRWAWNYLKSYAWAEWAMELWLLKIKEKGYWIDEDLSQTSSGILSFYPWKSNEPKINYKMDIWTKYFSWSLKSWETVIIPLFSNNNWSLISTYSPTLTITDWTKTDLIWNIIWQWEWMSWSWEIDFSKSYNVKQNKWDDDTRDTYIQIIIEDFLKRNVPYSWWPNNLQSYLMLFNKGNTIEYNLSVPSEELFSKPVWTIISSVTVGKFRQNITTNIDNTEFLKMLKYSLYSK